MSIPEYTSSGYLPVGHWSTHWDEFEERFGYNETRRRLMKGLKRLIKEFANSSLKCLYVNGSFVTSKEEPGDYDVGINVEEMTREELIDFRKRNPDFTQPHIKEKKQRLREKYLGDIILDDNALDFIDELFCTDRDGTPKGIIKLIIK